MRAIGGFCESEQQFLLLKMSMSSLRDFGILPQVADHHEIPLAKEVNVEFTRLWLLATRLAQVADEFVARIFQGTTADGRPGRRSSFCLRQIKPNQSKQIRCVDEGDEARLV